MLDWEDMLFELERPLHLRECFLGASPPSTPVTAPIYCLLFGERLTNGLCIFRTAAKGHRSRTLVKHAALGWKQLLKLYPLWILQYAIYGLQNHRRLHTLSHAVEVISKSLLAFCQRQTLLSQKYFGVLPKRFVSHTVGVLDAGRLLFPT